MLASLHPTAKLPGERSLPQLAATHGAGPPSPGGDAGRPRRVEEGAANFLEECHTQSHRPTCRLERRCLLVEFTTCALIVL